MKSVFYMNLLLFGVFFGMTLTHIVNGFYWSAGPTGLVMLLFVPGLLLGNK